MIAQLLNRDFTQRVVSIALALFIATFSFPPIARAEGELPPETEVPPTTVTDPQSEPVPEPTPVETPAQPTPETTTPAPTPGPQQPTGADSNSYTYNESTGLWENSKYTWDPVTKQTSPKTTPTYSYNPSTGMWDTTEWIYDAPSGVYVPNVISLALPPAGAEISNDPASLEQAADTPGLSTASALRSANSSSPQSLNSPNTPTTDTKSTGVFDLFYNAFISNNLNSTAITGDALVDMNTLAGNALSGDASAIATIFNLMQSAWNLGITGNAFTTFTQNIFGNMIGDLWLTPPSGGSGNTELTNDTTINADATTGIHNTINLEANSGNAGVTNNTTAGDATTGSATVIANIINAINSSIVSGNSFLGMLNIYGSLDGDILLPQELISTLLAANAIGTLDTSAINNSEIIGQFNNDLSTVNNVNAAATSGNANVTNNTSAGNATTGDAETNITLLNLTGKQVVGKNTLLVFVNVLGKWVGVLVDAPQGSTSAAFGGGITENNTLDVTQNNNQSIVNDINVAANSGDATVANNTSAGNATTGDAYAAVNILNLNSSQFALSDWFGVLFINVFGTWNGSFGIDTAAGTLPLLASTGNTNTSNAPIGNTLGVSQQNIKAYAFHPNSDGTYSLQPSEDGVAALASANVLSSSSSSSPKHKNKPTLADSMKNTDWSLTAIGMTLGVGLLGAERYLSRRSPK